MKQPIASKSVCNTLAIAIYDIEYGINDYVIARYEGIGYQLETPQKYERRLIHYDERAWFKFHGSKEYIDEYIKI